MNIIRNPKPASRRFPARAVLDFRSRTSDFGLRTSDLVPPPSAFTLIEVILAMAICAIVLVAINAVFATAVRLRNNTTDIVEKALPLNRALDLLRKDLKGAVGPGGYLAGDFKCGAQSMGANMGLSGEAGGSGLDFFTSTGVISDSMPWGDLQEVFYELKTPSDRKQPGLDLVRCVNRNLLATATQTPDVQPILSGVETVQFECYDGTQWRTSWDTSLGDTNLPNAIRIRLQMTALEGEDARNRQPVEMMVPLVTQTSRTNSVSTNGVAQ